ncbi:class II aldolase/adducin family protein [Demequina sp. SO4-13]|uniref:class II aldolase/adducin family protein n=1 Tax=Demequina sp. SO4-13 TaxID=3401027 RepID=UPI003AF4C94C
MVSTTNTPLKQCVVASQRLGSDPFLVLYGGGNSSAKADSTVYVKASGHDMGTITAEGFAPLDRDAVVSMLEQDRMSDGDLVAGLRKLLLDPKSSNPSIETPLHALVPYASVLHTHADAIVTLTNTVESDRLIESVLGSRVAVVPYCMPGFALAKYVQSMIETVNIHDLEGIVLKHHGLFTFGPTAEVALDRHLRLVDRASAWIARATGVQYTEDPEELTVDNDSSQRLTALRTNLDESFGGEFVLDAVTSPSIAAFVARPDLDEITQRGPTTLEHVIRTKRVPLVDGDITRFAKRYRAYFDRHRPRYKDPLVMLEPYPCVALDPDFGICGIGRTAQQARAARTIYRHTARIIEAAESLGGYRSISEADAFDIEYWELEQAKLR